MSDSGMGGRPVEAGNGYGSTPDIQAAGEEYHLARQAGATIAEWVLRRVDGQGSETIAYAWAHGDTSAPVTVEDLAAALRG